MSALTNLHWSDALIAGLTGAGVELVVISPGSRSTPLVLACLRNPGLRTRVLVDERSAAFFALGAARASQRPVALLATSGSAPAHWHPAVIEAWHSGVPLILLSADRPAELQDWGANQTTDQSRLFGRHVRAFHQTPDAVDGAEARRALHALAVKAVHQSRWPDPGPVHINIPLREPLVPDGELPARQDPPAAPAPFRPPRMLPDALDLDRALDRIRGRRGVIVCGPAGDDPCFRQAVTRLARALHCPILADPLSGLRFGPHDRSHVMSRYDAFLRNEGFATAHAPQWVLRFGAWPVSKTLGGWLAAARGGDHLLCSAGGAWLDPEKLAGQRICATPASLCDALVEAALEPVAADWFDAFEQAEARAARRAETVGAPPEWGVIRDLLDRLEDGTTLFSGNSLPIRQLDAFSGTASKRIRIVANRGVSGIDGGVSTLAGLAHEGTGPAVALLGDLALFHDLNGLLAARDEELILVVLNNHGGGIFEHLPQARLAAFESHWLTPTGLDPAKMAELFGIGFRCTDAAGFGEALEQAAGAGGAQMIEVRIDRRISTEGMQNYWRSLGACRTQGDRGEKVGQRSDFS